MLSLKQALSLSSTKLLAGGDFEPTDISSLQLWYKNLAGMENQDGETDPNDFIDSDKITWQSQVGSNLLDNDQNWNKPAWSSGQMAINIAHSKFYEFTTPLSLTADFSFCFSVRLVAIPYEDGLLGEGSSNMLEIQSASTFAFRADGTPEHTITHASETIAADKWYTIIVTRESGTLSIYVDGGGITNTLWGTATDTDTFAVETVGSWNNDAQNLNGYIRDLSYFNAALSSSEIANMIAYINNY
tara:strand:- start:1276 stop:2007 length:732 start_codon:yes stop_codon:yes gene_type:complete